MVTHRQPAGRRLGAEFTEHTHYLRLYMGQLRAKLEADPAEPQLLLTEPGVGYRLVEPRRARPEAAARPYAFLMRRATLRPSLQRPAA